MQHQERKKNNTQPGNRGSQAWRVNYCMGKIIFKEEKTPQTDH